MNTLYIVGAFAFVAVLLTSLFKNVEFSARVKNIIAIVFSSIGGLATVYFSGALEKSATDIFAAVLLVYGAQQALYNFLFDGSGLDAKLADINVLPSGKG